MTADTHEAAVARLRETYAALPPGTPVRLAKRTSNLFRFRDNVPKAPAGAAAAGGLDVSAFGHVLEIDPVRRTARGRRHDHLRGPVRRDAAAPADAAGGPAAQDDHPRRGGHRAGHRVHFAAQRDAARVGHRDGDPDRRRPRHSRATADNEHADLFHGFPNSLGNLGYALSLTIELEPVQPFVHLRHFPFATPDDCMDAIAQIAAERRFRGHRADFVDGTAFSPDELYLTVGAFSEVRPGAATTPASRSTTSRSASTRRISSPSAITCGGGIPTGSGAHGPSACRIPPRRLWPRRYRR